MPNYQKAKIYEIVGGGMRYIGSTCKKLSQRKTEHKSRPNKCMSKVIISNYEWEINLIEEYPCNSKEELLFRETFWITNLYCINRQIPIIAKETKKLNKNKQARDKRTRLAELRCYNI